MYRHDTFTIPFSLSLFLSLPISPVYFQSESENPDKLSTKHKNLTGFVTIVITDAGCRSTYTGKWMWNVHSLNWKHMFWNRTIRVVSVRGCITNGVTITITVDIWLVMLQSCHLRTYLNGNEANTFVIHFERERQFYMNATDIRSFAIAFRNAPFKWHINRHAVDSLVLPERNEANTNSAYLT